MHLLGWTIFLAASAILIGACYLGMQIYSFNQFALLLLVTPAAMLLLLKGIQVSRPRAPSAK